MGARKLSEIAARLGLTLRGDDAEVIGVNTLESAGPDEVSFLANPKYADQLAETRAGAVIVRPEHAGDVARARYIGDWSSDACSSELGASSNFSPRRRGPSAG